MPETELTLREKLYAPFPREWEKKKLVDRKTDTYITFVPWYRYVERLDEIAPGWSTRTMQSLMVGGRLLMEVEVTIGGVSRANWGDEEASKDTYGTPSTNAWAQGFKRACASHGLGLYMYHGSDPYEADDRPRQPRQEQPKQDIDEIAPSDAASVKLNFGKHNGKTLGELMQDKSTIGYVKWLAGDGFEIKDDDRYAQEKWALKAAALAMLDDLVTGASQDESFSNAPKARSAR